MLKRLYFIAAEEGAGNNNVRNKKFGVLRYVSEKVEKSIDTLRGNFIFNKFAQESN